MTNQIPSLHFGILGWGKSKKKQIASEEPVQAEPPRPRKLTMREQIDLKVAEATRQKANLPEFKRVLDMKCKLAGDVEVSGLELVQLIGATGEKNFYKDMSAAKKQSRPAAESKPMIVKSLLPNLDNSMTHGVLGLMDSLEKSGFIQYHEEYHGANSRYASEQYRIYQVKLTALGKAAAKEADQTVAFA